MKEKDDLQEAIEKAVADSLPKTAGDLLQKRLAEADEMELQIGTKDLVIENFEEEVKTLGEKVGKLEEREQETKDRLAKAEQKEKENNLKELDLESKEREES